jgi:hypothetical protein
LIHSKEQFNEGFTKVESTNASAHLVTHHVHDAPRVVVHDHLEVFAEHVRQPNVEALERGLNQQ